MLESKDVDVVLFRTEYKETLEKLARDNTPLATYLSLAPEPTKEEFLMNFFSIIYSILYTNIFYNYFNN